VRVRIALIEGYSFTREPVSLGIPGIAAAARRLEDLGFDGILSAETAGHDPFFPLLVAAEHTRRVELATGVAVAFPRSPMVVAQMAWDLQRFSQGRFRLGLGTQVKGHNERRYGTPWTGPPGPRMREYVQCLRAIFETFQNREEPRSFEGEHYRFSMLPPVFSPEPIEHPQIPIQVAAVNPYMSRLGGELCDGVFAHPICTGKYMRERLLPEVAAGARKAGRDPSEIEVIGAPVIVTGRDAAGGASRSTPRRAPTTPSSRSTGGRSWEPGSTPCRWRTAGRR
jgi:probable F420-dependent oxidoreductase